MPTPQLHDGSQRYDEWSRRYDQRTCNGGNDWNGRYGHDEDVFPLWHRDYDTLFWMEDKELARDAGFVCGHLYLHDAVRRSEGGTRGPAQTLPDRSQKLLSDVDDVPSGPSAPVAASHRPDRLQLFPYANLHDVQHVAVHRRGARGRRRVLLLRLESGVGRGPQRTLSLMCHVRCHMTGMPPDAARWNIATHH